MDPLLVMHKQRRNASLWVWPGACDPVEKLTAKDVMQYGVVSVEKTEPVYRAVSLLLDKGISGVAGYRRGAAGRYDLGKGSAPRSPQDTNTCRGRSGTT